MTLAVLALITALTQSREVAPLPAETPIGGPLWSYVIPAALLAIAALGTFMLYRHFAAREQ
jgi:hypothetical protein